MKRLILWLRDKLLTIVAALRWVGRQVKWLFDQVRRLVVGILGPPRKRISDALRAVKDKIRTFIDWLLDIWHRLWRTGKTGKRVRDERVGANGAPLLATLTLAAAWYLLPSARWLGFGPGRFVLWAGLIWVLALITWLSRCRADREGRVARFAQRVYRSTGLRRFDQLMLVPALLLCYVVTREIQLLPLGLGALVSVFALLIVEHEPRPELRFQLAPAFPDADVDLDDAGSEAGGGADDAHRTVRPPTTPPSGRWLVRRLSWTVTAHGRAQHHEVNVRIDQAALEAAREDNPQSSDDHADIVDWVLHGTGPEVVELARQIHDSCFANAYSLYATVSSFVAASQSIRYIGDLESMGHEEYWRYPVETLADGEGDCEDSAILLAALLRRAGFRCALLLSSDHAAVGVEVPHDTPGSYFERDGVRYYYCETTADGWIIGSMPPGVELDRFSFIPVPAWDAGA